MAEPLKCPFCGNARIVWMHPSQTSFNCPNCLESFISTVPYPPPKASRSVDCVACGKLINRNAAACPKCGADQYIITPEVLAERERAAERNSRKVRQVYSALALGLGFFGAHNFYAGHLTRAIPQLLFSVVFYWTIFVPVMIWIWAGFEGFICKEDAEGKVLI